MTDVTPDKVSMEELSLVRTEMLSALGLFLEHLKYTVTLMSSIIAVALALASFGLEKNGYANLSVVVSSLLLLSVLPISIYSKEIVRRYYKIYAANYIYSARLHKAVGATPEHPWNQDLTKCGFIEDIDAEDAIEKFIQHVCKEENHSWHYYRRLLIAFGVSCTAAALAFPIYWFGFR